MTPTESTLAIDFEALEERLAEADCEIQASEVQAIMCGLLAAGLHTDKTDWLELIISVVNDGRVFVGDTMDMLRQTMNWTQQQLAENDSLAPLLVPDDDYPLIDRMESLAFWCQGFLLGFGLQTGNRTIDDVEVEEALGDLTEIARLELDGDDSEVMQQAFETLIEHVKVAVKVIYWEMVVKTVPGATPTIKGNETYH